MSWSSPLELVLADDLMDGSSIKFVVIVLTLVLVFLSSWLFGKSMVDLFR